MPRRGATLIEILVVVGVLGLLIGIILPAVQAAREAARRSQCVNRLKQIALAMNAYMAREGVLPSAMMKGDPTGVRPGQPWHYYPFSPFARVLPELGEQAAFDAIAYGEPPEGAGNGTARSIRLDTFLCPSDGGPMPEGSGPANYRANVGSHTSLSGGLSGAFEVERWFGAAAITDGLSNTALLSEKLRGDRDQIRWDPRRDVWYSGIARYVVLPVEEVISACAKVPGALPSHSSIGGDCWLIDGYMNTYYNHAVGPDSIVPDCTTSGDASFPRVGADGVFGARSAHGRGVNLATADGSVRWVADGVSLGVWRALGTRAGNETIGDP